MGPTIQCNRLQWTAVFVFVEVGWYTETEAVGEEMADIVVFASLVVEGAGFGAKGPIRPGPKAERVSVARRGIIGAASTGGDVTDRQTEVGVKAHELTDFAFFTAVGEAGALLRTEGIISVGIEAEIVLIAGKAVIAAGFTGFDGAIRHAHGVASGV